jgi:hypothetical protein
VVGHLIVGAVGGFVVKCNGEIKGSVFLLFFVVTVFHDLLLFGANNWSGYSVIPGHCPFHPLGKFVPWYLGIVNVGYHEIPALSRNIYVT